MTARKKEWRPTLERWTGYMGVVILVFLAVVFGIGALTGWAS
jgi:hypothetical protein